MRIELMGRMLAGLSILGLFGCRDSPSWEAIQERVRREFPDVEHIAPDELEGLMEQGETPVLLDVREEAEFAVSHLKGARRVPPGSVDEIALELDPKTPIVAYCSVGYRSSALAAALEARGFENVRNLDGSIFAWANGGRPVVRDGEPVREVHPYDEEWGRLLNEELRAYAPGGK